MKLIVLRTAITVLSILALLGATPAAVTAPGKAAAGIPQTADTDAIRKVIAQSYQLEAEAGHTFDTSRFADVFTNDPRGGQLSPSTIEFIESVPGAGGKSTYGYLDYKLAYFSWWEQGALKIERLKLKTNAENRQMTAAEMRSLYDQQNRLAMPRLQGEVSAPHLSFHSIEIQGDTAVAIFDDGPRTNQMTLTKTGTNWRIAGNRFTAIHP